MGSYLLLKALTASAFKKSCLDLDIFLGSMVFLQQQKIYIYSGEEVVQ